MISLTRKKIDKLKHIASKKKLTNPSIWSKFAAVARKSNKPNFDKSTSETDVKNLLKLMLNEFLVFKHWTKSISPEAFYQSLKRASTSIK